MTGNEMLAQLGQRMEDTTSVEYTSAIKLEALNNAQLRIISLLPSSLLDELDELATALTTSPAGTLTFGAIVAGGSNAISLEGIQKVKINAGKFCSQITLEDLDEISDNTYLTASQNAPYYWTRDESVFCLPVYSTGTTAQKLDVYYKRNPVELAASATECELDPSLHETVLDLAEATLWLTAHRPDRSQVAENRALSFIKVLRGE